MIQCGRRAGFALKALASLRILGQIFWQELEGHTSAQAEVFSLVHDSHATAAQLAQNAVMGDGLAQHGAFTVGRLC